MTISKNVRILGSGVIGLSTAITLAEHGYSCEVISRTANQELLLEDASDKACSIWYPILASGSQELMDAWATHTYKRLADMSRRWPDAVRAVTDIEIIDSEDEFEAPAAALRVIPDFTSSTTDGPLPKGSVGSWRFTSYVVAMQQYLRYLQKEAFRLGVVFTKKTLERIEGELLDAQLGPVINCTGLGSRQLVPDQSMRAIKGHLLFYDPVPLSFAIGRYDFAIMPRPDYLAVGVLFIEDFESLTPMREDRERILAEIMSWQRADVLNLGLARLNLNPSRIRREVVGLRPYRPSGIRVESEISQNQLVIHNYGHGGSGVSLSWGCALEVYRILRSLVS